MLIEILAIQTVRIVFDLEDYYPKGIRTQIDISQWLLEGFLLKEKDGSSPKLVELYF